MKGFTQNKTVFSDFETLQSFAEIKAKNFIYLYKKISEICINMLKIIVLSIMCITCNMFKYTVYVNNIHIIV